MSDEIERFHKGIDDTLSNFTVEGYFPDANDDYIQGRMIIAAISEKHAKKRAREEYDAINIKYAKEITE